MTTVETTGHSPIVGILNDERRFALCAVLSLLLLLLYSHHFWYIKIPLSVIAISGFIFTPLRTSRTLWGLVTIIIIAGTYGNWYTVDNHKYLLGYWCLAIFVALLTRAPMQTLSKSARWIIALVFLLAVLQKSVSDNYLNGTFFYYELLLDERFYGLAEYVGGIPDHFNALNKAARRALVNFDSTLTTVHLEGTENTAKLAVFITWANYLIQMVIGILFLVPRSTWLSRIRNAWLLAFLFTTYLFAPVIGFGWVLAIMGIAQTEPHQTTTRALYVGAFLFLQIYRIPWGELFAAVSGFAAP